MQYLHFFHDRLVQNTRSLNNTQNAKLPSLKTISCREFQRFTRFYKMPTMQYLPFLHGLLLQYITTKWKVDYP
jgi:hypothetical protein